MTSASPEGLPEAPLHRLLSGQAPLLPPPLFGVVHLPALPGSPRFAGDWTEASRRALDEARILAECGFDGVVLENFGDAPFLPGQVGPETVASLTVCAARVRQAFPALALGINVLRCDPGSALAIAGAAGADFIRINVHSGARLTDQGIIQGQAHETLRQRRSWQLESVRIFADVDVKHSQPLAPIQLEDEIQELEHRALADALLLTGPATGQIVQMETLERARSVATRPLLLGSGLTPATCWLAEKVDGALVSSYLRQSGRAGAPLSPERCRELVQAWKDALNSASASLPAKHLSPSSPGKTAP